MDRTIEIPPRFTLENSQTPNIKHVAWKHTVTFTNIFFTIQNRQMGRVVATGKRYGGLYVLEHKNSTFVSFLKNKSLHASYDLWHARLGHVNHFIISFLNKKGQLYLTSLLPSPTLSNICQIAKNHRLPYSYNECWSSKVLELIHCNLWGPSPIKSNSSFAYYALLTDDYSHFTWLYPLKFKSDFFNTFIQFQKFVENQHSACIKKNFKVTMMQNSLATVLKHTLVPLTFINSLVLIHQYKTIALKRNIAMWLKQVWHSFFILTFPLIFGLTLLALQLTSSTVCPHRFSKVSHLLNS